jgi:hypothetical protein
MTDKIYNLYISSSDKLSGTNNNCSFFVQWDTFLPKKYTTFKVGFTCSSPGPYVDGAGVYYGSCELQLNTHSKNFSYETSSRGQSNVLGYLNRDGAAGFLEAWNGTNPSKMMTFPTSNVISFNFINNWNNQPMVTSNNPGDMGPWVMVLQFTAIE